MSKVAIGDGDGSGSHNGIDETVMTSGHGNMVNPNIGGTEDGNAVAIAHCPQTHMVDSVSDHPTSTHDDVMNTKAMDDDILDVLKSNASPICNLNIGPSSIDGLVAGHNELLIEPNGHVGRKGYPERPFLDHGMTQGPRFWVHKVRVRRVVHHVVWTQLAAGGLAAETQNASGQLLTVVGPIWVASPAPIDGICGSAWPCVFLQTPPRTVASTPFPASIHFSNLVQWLRHS